MIGSLMAFSLAFSGLIDVVVYSQAVCVIGSYLCKRLFCFGYEGMIIIGPAAAAVSECHICVEWQSLGQWRLVIGSFDTN